MRKLLFTLLLVCLFGMARGQTTALYWFDNQLEAANNVIVTGGSFEADATALSDGLHALHVQCVLSDGTSSDIHLKNIGLTFVGIAHQNLRAVRRPHRRKRHTRKISEQFFTISIQIQKIKLMRILMEELVILDTLLLGVLLLIM